jgi:hypothetical protein
MGKTRKRCPMPKQNFKGKDIGPEIRNKCEVHCVSDVTRIKNIYFKTKYFIGIYSNIKYVTRSFKEYSCTNAPAFLPLINVTASLLHKRCKKSLTTS